MKHQKAASAIVAVVLASTACGSEDSEPISDNSSGVGAGGTVGVGGAAAAGGTPGPQVVTNVPTPSPEPQGQLIVGSTEPVVMEGKTDCAGIVMEPETLIYEEPVMMYLVLDNSKSMIEGAKNGSPNKWEQAVTAFTEFVRDPASEGIDVGIQYFHPEPPPALIAEFEAEQAAKLDPDDRDNFRYRPDECDGMAHAQSAVDVARLPEGAEVVVESLAAANPRSNTPTVGALTGGVNYCKQFQQEHPDEQCVVVFVTDGQPNGCGLDLGCHKGFEPNHKGHCVDPQSEEVLSPIAKDAHDNFGVNTYTVGMEGVIEDGFDLLDQLAIVGGTDCTPDVPGEEACNVTETGGAGLLDTLNKIRDTIVMDVLVPCRWVLPEPPDGKSLNPDQVNVSLQLRGEEVPLGRVNTEAECATVEGGWYYDKPLMPSEIRTCPQTCQIVQQNPDDVRASLEFGCATRPAGAK